MNFRINGGYLRVKPPSPVRVYAKNPGKPVEVYDAAPPIEAAIKQVKELGFERALILIK